MDPYKWSCYLLGERERERERGCGFGFA